MEFLIPALFFLQAVIWRAVWMLPYRWRQMDADTLAALSAAIERNRPDAVLENTASLWAVRQQRLSALARCLEATQQA